MSDRVKFDEDFRELVAGWMLVDDFDELTDRIDAVSALMKREGIKLEDLDDLQRPTVRMMIESLVARGVKNGDFSDCGFPAGTDYRIGADGKGSFHPPPDETE